MKKIFLIVLLALFAVACSIKEDRSDCPSFVDIVVNSQDEEVFNEGKVWCCLWDDNVKFVEGVGDNMNESDALFQFDVYPKRTVWEFTTNLKVDGSCCIAKTGEQFPALYGYSRQLPCLVEEVRDTVFYQNKQFCNLVLTLCGESKELSDKIQITVTAPYNGCSYPDFSEHQGEYSYTTKFNTEGQSTIRIPRQGDPGLSIFFTFEDGHNTSYDLFTIMKDGDYSWTDPSLLDFTLKIDYDKVSLGIIVLDWEIVDLGGKEF